MFICRIVEMYHAKLDDNTKERVMKGISEDGKVKLLFTTVAFGLGIDIKNIDIVVVWGPRNFIQLYQEVGRCARGIGKSGIAYVFLTGKTIAKCKDPAILDLCKVTKSDEKMCLRRCILQKFVLDGMPEDEVDTVIHKEGCNCLCQVTCECDMCKCCNNCQMKCKCPAAVRESMSNLHC